MAVTESRTDNRVRRDYKLISADSHLTEPGDLWTTRVDQQYRIVLDALEPPIVLLPEYAVAMRVEPRIEGGLPRYPEVSQDSAGEVRYASSDDLADSELHRHTTENLCCGKRTIIDR